jgi:glycosyltransferase involved in cell wall biosynthesis
MSIAVIIPARNAERVIGRTLAALEGADEVLVVDNGSRDDTSKIAAGHGARVVRHRRPSRPGARNAGASSTKAGKLLFLDADCVPDPGWAIHLARALDEHDLAAGRTIVAGTGSPAARFDTLWRLRQEDTIAQGWAGSGNLAIRRPLFDRLGGFDTRFTKAGEDVDLCLRAGRLGYAPQAIVRHAPASTTEEVLRRGFRHGFGATQLHHRHQGRIGRQDWKHPRPLVAGDWVLERFGLADHPELKGIAKADYAGRVIGSAWAELRRAR